MREALEDIRVEADSHWEHNPVSNKARQPKGYVTISQMASVALRADDEARK